MRSLPPAYFLAKVLSMIGAVLRKNAALYVYMNLCITMQPSTNSKTVKIRLIAIVENSWGKGCFCVKGIIDIGIIKKIVKIRKAISSGKVSLMLPLYPNLSREISSGNQIICRTATTTVRVSYLNTINL